MLHVDEGQLHALLDGAFADAEARALHQHISACAECTAQLEEARALRARSTAILGAAQPARLPVPPFESVLAQSQKQAPPRRFAWFALNRLAQAAMIVLALGIGWFSRDLTMRAREAANDRALAPASEGAPAPVTVPAPSAPPASEPFDKLSNTGATGALRRESEVAQDQRAGNELAKVRENKDAERDEARKSLVSADAGQAAGQTQQRQSQAPAQQQAQVQQTLRQQENLGARNVQAATAARAQVPQAAPAASRFADAVANQRWQYMSLDSAEQLTGRRVLRVPELRILNVGVSSTPAGYAVLVNQLFDNGAILELQQRPEVMQRNRADVESRVVKEEVVADASRSNEVSLQRAGLTIIARGFVSADSLRVLLQRVR